MSNFQCPECKAYLIDSEEGYITSCPHYPIEEKQHLCTELPCPVADKECADKLKASMSTHYVHVDYDSEVTICCRTKFTEERECSCCGGSGAEKDSLEREHTTSCQSCEDGIRKEPVANLRSSTLDGFESAVKREAIQKCIEVVEKMKIKDASLYHPDILYIIIGELKKLIK